MNKGNFCTFIYMVNNILVWVILFCTYFAICWFVLKRFGVTLVSKPVVFVSVSSLFIALTLSLFNEELFPVVGNWEFLFTLFLISLVLWGLALLLYPLYRSNIQDEPEENLNCMKFKKTFILNKYFEIVYQQLMLYVLFIFVSDWFEYSILTGIVFSLIFGGVHIPLIINFSSKKVSLVYILSSFIFGFIYPYLISNNKNWILATFSFHYLFYILLVPMAYIIGNKEKKKSLS